MFVEHLALSYSCHSSIGNSLDLKKMLEEVINTFVTQTDAISGAFFLKDDENNLYKYLEFDQNFDEDVYQYLEESKNFSIVVSKKNNSKTLIIIPTKNGNFYIIYNTVDLDADYIGSMFQDLIVKLNISIDACLNMQRLKSKNNQLDKLAQRLEDQKKELENLNKYQTNFLANISHELKTPLNSIIVLSNLMSKNKDQTLTQKNLKNMKIINSCGNDLLNLINDILDISKIESKELSLYLKKVNIIEIVDDVYHQISPLAVDRGLKLSRIYNISESVILFTDDGRIKQILKNLLSNAVKFTHTGEIIIDLSMDDEYIFIKVIDEGIGIEQSKINTIFERFKQADGSTTRKYGGTGLGLSVSKEITELLNGTLTADSKLGEGSTFELKLPIKTNIANISDEKVSLGEDKSNNIEDFIIFEDFPNSKIDTKKQPAKPKVLFVNDDHIMFFTNIINLQKNGVEIDKVDHLEITKKIPDYYDLIVINDNYEKNDILDFIEQSDYSKDKFLIISNDSYDIKHTLTHDNIKSEFVKTILKILGMN